MNRQAFEDLLSGPQTLTSDSLKAALEYARTETNCMEFKREFERRDDGRIVLVEFCKVIIGLLNSETGGVIVYGVSDAINENTEDPVDTFIMGHDISRAKVEDLVGYLKERTWPAEVWMVHIKQLPISERKAVTTIFVGRGRSKPYLYYVPEKPESGIRSFARGSRVTYELAAPQLHLFFAGGSKSPLAPQEPPELPTKTGLTNVSSLMKENYAEALKIVKDPEEFGLTTICVYPSSHVSVSDADIKNLLEPRSRDAKRMEEIWYGQMEVSQKWYRRLFIPYQLAEERKCTWAITCYRRTGVLFVNSLVDEYMQGKRYLNPFYLAYQIQRLLQMANELYGAQTTSFNLAVDFKHLQSFGYLVVWFGSVERTVPYVGYADPIELEIKPGDVYTADKADLTMPVVQECMEEVAKIFGQDRLPNPLSNSQGEMVYVEYFKGTR